MQVFEKENFALRHAANVAAALETAQWCDLVLIHDIVHAQRETFDFKLSGKLVA